MFKSFFATFLLVIVMFSYAEGFSNMDSIESLYKSTLQPEYQQLHDMQEQAKKQESAYIISAVIAVIVLFVFSYYFKFIGFIVALIMIGAGYFTLQKSEPKIGMYENHFKERVISPITKLLYDYTYVKDTTLSEKDLINSKIFNIGVKSFASWDMYAKEGVIFSYLHVVFDSQMNKSVERIPTNIFDGYFIMIDKPTTSNGVLVSHQLRDKVGVEDIQMQTFFADGKYVGKQNSFDIYGDVSIKDLDKASALHNKMVAISYDKDKIYIALNREKNGFNVDTFKRFDLLKAKQYANEIAYVDEIVNSLY